MHTIGPALLATLGTLLLLFCIFTEGEPTAIPLLLLAVSGVWYAAMRLRRRGRAMR